MVTERNTVAIELTPEEILALTTTISVFKDLTIGMGIDVPKELRKTLANVIEKIMLELMYDDRESK